MGQRLRYGPCTRWANPLYLMKITGLAKILGAFTLLLSRPVHLMEWARAG